MVDDAAVVGRAIGLLVCFVDTLSGSTGQNAQARLIGGSANRRKHREDHGVHQMWMHDTQDLRAAL